MFKKGDIVRRNRGAWFSMKEGDTGVVRACSDGFLLLEGVQHALVRYDPACYEPAGVVPQQTTLPTDSAERKGIPLAEGFLFYFPAAIAEVAKLSKAGNDQHNPGQPMHWARDKSKDHHDCLMRHLLEAGTLDTDGVRHSAKVAWRALAALQVELEAAGAPVARNAK